MVSVKLIHFSFTVLLFWKSLCSIIMITWVLQFCQKNLLPQDLELPFSAAISICKVESRWLFLRWFPSFALCIPTAHDFCIISARKWARERVRVQNVRNFPRTKLDSVINARFFLNKHGDPHFLFYKFNENNILNNREKNWQKSMASFLANEINATDRDVMAQQSKSKLCFL